MKSFHRFNEAGSGSQGVEFAGYAILPAVLLAFLLGMAGTVHAQVVQAADRGGLMISVGGTASGNYLQYGERKMLGVSGFADFDTPRSLGIESEASFLMFHQTANVHDEVYSIGPRYHRNIGWKLQPYAKALVGLGEFNFPYSYAQGSYLVITPGAGIEYRLSRRIHIRAVDFEYQLWPQFTFGSMSAASVSSGIRVRVF